MGYKDFCEVIFHDWKHNRLQSHSKLFELEVVPEPYLLFGSGEKPLYQLLTNPGTGMPEIQSHSALEKLGVESYKELADRLAEYYLSDKFKGAGLAYRRNYRALEVAEANGFTGVMNVETIPYHSDRLNKTQALKAIEDNAFLSDYTQKLKTELADKAVLVVAACSSKQSIDQSTIANSKWLSFQADLIGLRVSKAKLTPLVSKGGKVTAAQLRDGQKNMVLMMGSNALPKGRIEIHN
jgi:hypothetical protein